MTWKPTGGWCMRIEELGSLEPEVGKLLGADEDGSWAIQDAAAVRSTLSLVPGTHIPSLDGGGKVPTSQLELSVSDVTGAADVSDSRFPTSGQKAALAGTGTPGSGDLYVNSSDARLTNSRAPTGSAGGDFGGSYPNPSVESINGISKTTLTSRLPSADQKAALVGTGMPSSTDLFVNNSDPRLEDARAPTGSAGGDFGGNYPNPTVESINGISKTTLTSRLPSADQKAALAGTQGTPNDANRFVTSDDARLGSAVTGTPKHRGPWDAAANTPNLSTTSPSDGDFYIVTSSTTTTTLGGISIWDPNDWAMYRGGAWTKIDHTPTVTARAGKVPAADGSGKIDSWVSTASTSNAGLARMATNGESNSTRVLVSNDSRLSDARIPTGSAGGSLTGTFPNPTIGAGAVTYDKMQDVAALSVVGRWGNAPATAAAITAGSDGDVLRRSGTTLGFGAISQSSVTGLTTDLAAKAALASPTFTGTPAAPTASIDTNSTQVATTAWATKRVYPNNYLSADDGNWIQWHSTVVQESAVGAVTAHTPTSASTGLMYRSLGTTYFDSIVEVGYGTGYGSSTAFAGPGADVDGTHFYFLAIMHDGYEVRKAANGGTSVIQGSRVQMPRHRILRVEKVSALVLKWYGTTTGTKWEQIATVTAGSGTAFNEWTVAIEGTAHATLLRFSLHN